MKAPLDWFPEIDPTNLRAEDFTLTIIEPPRGHVPLEVHPLFVLWGIKPDSFCGQ